MNTKQKPLAEVIAADEQRKLSEKKEKEIQNFQENIERYKDSIQKYLHDKIFTNLPEDYKDEYKTIFNNHFHDLQKKPIAAGCKFTLVLPAYREEKVILQTLESLQAQAGVEPGDFEVIVVNNYPKGKKPLLNDYDESGKKIGEHKDRTTEIINEFAKTSELKVRLIEQAFPDHIAGVGIASKLGMDLALRRQKDNPQIVGYYGADTIFDKNWVKGVMDGFKEKNIDGVRGVAKTGPIDNKIEDEHGLHVLSQQELDTLLKLEGERFKYGQKIYEMENIFKETLGEDKRQLTGLPTMTAGIYAKVGGIKAYSTKEKKSVTSGEDWQIAQAVADSGKIFWNKNMQTMTLPRIEKPRAKGGSYTEGMWNMFRAYYYGEGNLLDKDKNVLVENPEKVILKNKIGNLFKKIYAGLGDFETDNQLLTFFRQNELDQIKKLMKKYSENWDQFIQKIPKEIAAAVATRLDKLFPKMKIEDAEKKLDKIIDKL